MKRIISLLLCAVMLCGTLAVTAGAMEYVEDESFVLGDADGDGAVNAKDALAVKANVAGVDGYICNGDAADIDADGQISAKDAFFLKGSFVETVKLSDYENGYQVYKFSIGGNDISNYKIQIPADSTENDNVTFAAETLQKFIARVVGYTPEIVYGEAEGLKIAMTVVDPESEMGEQLGHDGYIYEVKEGNLYTYGTYRGNMYAVYEILEDYLNYKFYRNDCTYIFKSRTVEIKEGTYRTFRPKFDVRAFSGAYDSSFKGDDERHATLGLRLNGSMQHGHPEDSRYGYFEGGQYIQGHSFCYYKQMGSGEMPDESYGSLADRYQAKLDSVPAGSQLDRNPCTSDKNEYDVLFDGMMSFIYMLQARDWYHQPEEMREAGMLDFCFSFNDTTEFCMCRFCVAKANGTTVKNQATASVDNALYRYGGEYDYVPNATGKRVSVTFRKEGYTGAYIDMLNHAAEDVQEFFPGLRLYTILYVYDIPETIRPGSMVDLQYCGTGCSNHGLTTGDCYEEGGRLCYNDGKGKNNYYDEKKLAEWAEICKETGTGLWFYYYPISYQSDAYSTPNIFSMYYDYHYLGTLGIHLMMTESTSCENNLEALKAYLIARMCWKPEMSLDEYISHIKDFLYMHYGNGWEEMYEYVLMYEEAGDATGHCFLNNFDYGYDMFSYSYLNENYETMRALLDAAEAKTANPTQKARIERLRFCFDYLGLSAVHASWYTNGTAETRALYEERYTAMFNYFHANNIQGSYIAGTKFPTVIDFTKSPMEQNMVIVAGNEKYQVVSRWANSGWPDARDQKVGTVNNSK